MKRIFFILIFLFLINTIYSQTTALPDTIRTCRVDSVLLDAGVGFLSYDWNTGDTTSSIWVYTIGNYIVTVNSGDTLTITDTVYVYILYAQIAQNETTILCGDSTYINVDSANLTYLWEPGLEENDSIFIYPKDTSTYFVTITDPNNYLNYCIDSIKINVDARITIDSLYQINMGCPGEEKGQMKVDVSGGFPPYTYYWSAGYPLHEDSSIVIGLSDRKYTLKITDTIGCELKKKFDVKAFPIPGLEIITDPGDTIYIQRPQISFAFNNPDYDSLFVDSFKVTVWTWDFGDGFTSTDAAPTHYYSDVGTYDVCLNFTTFYGCIDDTCINVEVKPVKLKIPNVFTPNGDGINDKFEIVIDEEGDSGGGTVKSISSNTNSEKLINDYYLSNTLLIFNRWGKKVYEVNDYKNDWDGDNLSNGVYYYVLKCEGQKSDDVYKGSVTIIGKNK
ncbi:MAG: gliding motility-associated C-terminal domain-containing protein [Bacteroidales bacterium]|nr:gliding motility-associated C-terminal domain-containing protein [Bacteroidales bacterium]